MARQSAEVLNVEDLEKLASATGIPCEGRIWVRLNGDERVVRFRVFPNVDYDVLDNKIIFDTGLRGPNWNPLCSGMIVNANGAQRETEQVIREYFKAVYQKQYETRESSGT